jgi:hypothetical protein
MEFDTKFQLVMADLSTKATLPPAFTGMLRDSLIRAGFSTVSMAPTMTVSVAGAKTTPKGGRRTGYNLFASAKNVELKAAIADWPSRNKEIGRQWKAISETDKASWNAKATGQSAGAASPVRSKTGYNLYMKEQMPLLKAEHPTPSDRFSLIGKQWKALPQSERDAWNAKAKGVVVAAPATVVAAAAAAAAAKEPTEEEIEEVEEIEEDD